jgi:hypothetical protein
MTLSYISEEKNHMRSVFNENTVSLFTWITIKRIKKVYTIQIKKQETDHKDENMT